MADDADGLPAVQADAVEDLRMAGDLGMRNYGAVEGSEDVENARNDADAGEDAILLRHDSAGAALVRINHRVAGRVAGGAIFPQRVFKNGGDASGMEVHFLAVSDQHSALSEPLRTGQKGAWIIYHHARVWWHHPLHWLTAERR